MKQGAYGRSQTETNKTKNQINEFFRHAELRMKTNGTGARLQTRANMHACTNRQTDRTRASVSPEITKKPRLRLLSCGVSSEGVGTGNPSRDTDGRVRRHTHTTRGRNSASQNRGDRADRDLPCPPTSHNTRMPHTHVNRRRMPHTGAARQIGAREAAASAQKCRAAAGGRLRINTAIARKDARRTAVTR